MTKNVLLARRLVYLFPLFAGAQVHKRVEICQLVAAQSAERFVSLHAPKCILAVGADRYDLALALDGVNHVAQSVLLCEPVARGESFSVEGVFAETHLVGEALRVDDPVLGLSGEHGLDLLKN